jgi:hypothetical protein
MKTSSGTSKKKTTKKEAPKGAQTIGIDLGDLWSHYCVLDEAGNVAEEGRFRTTQAALQKHFGDIARARIPMEAGTHSIWISEQLRHFGDRSAIISQDPIGITLGFRPCRRKELNGCDADLRGLICSKTGPLSTSRAPTIRVISGGG